MTTPTAYHPCRLCGAPPDDGAPLHPGRPETVLCSRHRRGFRDFLARSLHPDSLDPEDTMTTAAPVPTTTDDEEREYVVLAASIGLTRDGASGRALQGETVRLDRARAERFLALGAIARPGEEPPPRQRPERPPAEEQLRQQVNAAAASSDARQERERRAREAKADAFLQAHGGSKDAALRAIGATGTIPVTTERGEALEPLSSQDILDAWFRSDEFAVDHEFGRWSTSHDVVHSAARVARDPDEFPADVVARARRTLRAEAEAAEERHGRPGLADDLLAEWTRERAR